jgi:uncharacterized repeat protein (TIGR02543 family)
VVSISAAPSAGWQFVNWSGDVADTNSANTTVIINSNKTITANFSRIMYGISIAVIGNGTTTTALGSYSYPAGTVVNITATPETGWQFSHWSGDASSTVSPVAITMTGNRNRGNQERYPVYSD